MVSNSRTVIRWRFHNLRTYLRTNLPCLACTPRIPALLSYFHHPHFHRRTRKPCSTSVFATFSLRFRSRAPPLQTLVSPPVPSLTRSPSCAPTACNRPRLFSPTALRNAPPTAVVARTLCRSPHAPRNRARHLQLADRFSTVLCQIHRLRIEQPLLLLSPFSAILSTLSQLTRC